MIRKERQRLLLELKMDPQGFHDRARAAISTLLQLKIDPQGFEEFDKRAREALFKENWQFLAQVLEALKSKEFIPFHEKVAAAYARLFPVHVGRDRLNAKRDRTKATKNLGDLIPVETIKKKVDAMFPEAANATPQQYSRAFRKLGLPPFKKQTRSK